MKIRNMCTLPLGVFWGQTCQTGPTGNLLKPKKENTIRKRNLGWIVFPNVCCLTHPLMVLHLGNNDGKKKTSSTLHRGESISVNVKGI